MYYPVSDEALEALVCLFKRFVFPEKQPSFMLGSRTGKSISLKRHHTFFCFTQWKTNNDMVSKEGDAACGSWDLYRNKAGFEYVETLEETTAYSVSIVQLNELYRSYIDLANWMRVLQQENFLRLQDIHIRRLNWSAKERYEHLIKECPELFQRVNLGYIASFLGITQQSLSRIRANGRFLT